MTNDEIQKIIEEASPLPWKYCGDERGGCSCGLVWSLPLDCVVAAAVGADDITFTCGEGVDLKQEKRNAAYIAMACVGFPRLLEENKRLREALQAIDQLHGGHCDHCKSIGEITRGILKGP